MKKISGFVLAGTNSGCGKTTIALALMQALKARGLVVQPFKVGPDYIDPKFHSLICGRPSRNLDSFLLEPAAIMEIFGRSAIGADISVVEGVMGLYDGRSGDSTSCSTYEMASTIGLPIVLVVNARGMALSVVALIKGFLEFGPLDPSRTGIILNNCSKNAYHFIKGGLEKYTGARLLGHIPRIDSVSLDERNLGLKILDDSTSKVFKDKMEDFAQKVAQTVDLDELVDMASMAATLSSDLAIHSKDSKKPQSPFDNNSRPLIAVAQDEAFNFYYQDNLDFLEHLGARLVKFSPIRDSLPSGASAIYIGGGYPELYARQLSENTELKNQIAAAAAEGMPIYGECGGLLYLGRSIDVESERYKMVGIFDFDSYMTSSLQRFGYVEINVEKECLVAGAGTKLRGHEFHYSAFSPKELPEEQRDFYSIKKRGKSWNCGYSKNRVFAAYAHLHFYSNKDVAIRFVEAAKCYNGSGGCDE